MVSTGKCAKVQVDRKMQERDQRDTTVLRKSPTVFTSVLKRKLAPDAFTSEQLRKSKCYQRYIGVVYIKSSKDVV